MLNRKKAFTMLELMVTLAVLSLLSIGVYKLFFSGSKTAAKAQWINQTVQEMRNASAILEKAIGASSYPATLFSDTIYEPPANKNKEVAKKFYTKILKDNQEIVPTTAPQTLMTWCACKPEKPPEGVGEIINYSLILEPESLSGVPSGNLYLSSEAFTFRTEPSQGYARSGDLNLVPLPKESHRKLLIKDVTGVTLTVAGHCPARNALDFFPLSIKIKTTDPKDTKVSKETSIMATPHTAITLI
ncbi:MAG: type II secretion system protein [Candidatus Riflebacteria bacterium]|nr:type II secretion system protein [Candidatus Riflebacteria bacterium]